MGWSCCQRCYIKSTTYEFWTSMYILNVLYVKLRRAKDSFKYNMQQPALLIPPSLHIGTRSIMLNCESCSQGNMPLGRECWGCIYSIGPQYRQLYLATPCYLLNCQHCGHTQNTCSWSVQCYSNVVMNTTELTDRRPSLRPFLRLAKQSFWE